MKKNSTKIHYLFFVLGLLAIILFVSGFFRKTPQENQYSLRITGKHEHPALHNPADIIQFQGKYVATELYKNRLAIFDDLQFSNLRHFDPQKIGKRFRSPHFLAVTPQNSLLISNGWGNSIIEIQDLEGKGWKEFHGFEPPFRAPHGICVDRDGWIYVGDSLNSRLVRFKDMDGTDWQVFADHEKKISYIRELHCKDDGVWISNSYEKREGLNPGNGSNVLKITNFPSGEVEVIHAVNDSNITGFIAVDDSLYVNLFKGQSVHEVKLTGKESLNTDQIIRRGSIGLGVPYGTYSAPEGDLHLISYFGKFDSPDNLGGFLSLREVAASQPDGLTWTMINVNKAKRQGDAHLIQVENGKTILVDTGLPQFTESEVLPLLRKKGIGTLNDVYISHAHLDHFGGLEVLANAGITIENAWFNPLNEEMCAREKRCYYDKYQDIQEKLASLKSNVQELNTGDIHDLGNGAQLRIIAAFNGKETPAKSKDVNDTSAIMMVEYSGFKLLFTGDLNKKMGGYLAKNANNIKADVLKVPHHGAEGLAPNEFFEKVSPRYALVPAPRQLWQSKRSQRPKEWMQLNKVPVYVNGISGNVSVIIRNNELAIEEQYPQKKGNRQISTQLPDNIKEIANKGHIDSATCSDGHVVIKGWAPWKDLNQNQTLYILSKDSISSPQLKSRERPDVAKVYAEPRYRFSGFELQFKTSGGCNGGSPNVCIAAGETQNEEIFLLQNKLTPKACEKYTSID